MNANGEAFSGKPCRACPGRGGWVTPGGVVPCRACEGAGTVPKVGHERGGRGLAGHPSPSTEGNR